MNRKPHFAHFGPEIPIVPVSEYSRIKLTNEQMAQLWWLCGPTAVRNMKELELWQVIAMAYLEGLNHGAGVTTEFSRVREAETT